MLKDFPKTIQLFVRRAKIKILDQSSFHPTLWYRPTPAKISGVCGGIRQGMSEHQAWHHEDSLADLALNAFITDISPSGSEVAARVEQKEKELRPGTG